MRNGRMRRHILHPTSTEEIPQSVASSNNNNDSSNPANNNNAESVNAAPTLPQQEDAQQPNTEQLPRKQSKRPRCDKCGKKLGLAEAYNCRCGGVFCALHRYSDRHDCNFDYRAMGAEQIRRENPVVIAEKVRKL